MKKFLLLLLLLFHLPAFGEQDLANQYKQTSNEFESVLSDYQLTHNGDLPGKRENVAGPLMLQLTDKSILQRFSTKDISALSDICFQGGVFFARYLMHDVYYQLGKDPSTSMKEKAEKLAIFIKKNIVRYRDEILMFQKFSIYCSSRGAYLLNSFWHELSEKDKTKIRIEGAKQAKLGMLQVVNGALQFLSDPVLDGNYRKELADVLAETAQQMSEPFSMIERQSVLGLYKRLDLESNMNILNQLTQFEKTFQSEKCSDLCKL